jgi:TPP-dependent pyruvate/acetoin dehydrogenase alpha subunit
MPAKTTAIPNTPRPRRSPPARSPPAPKPSASKPSGRRPGRLAVNELTQKLVARCRKGEGPFFVELMTYRYHGHHVGDINREYYRSKDEEKDWKENRDPIIRFRSWLVSEGIASEDDLEAMNAEIKADAAAAVEYALNAKYPDVSEVDMHVFTDVQHALA